MGEEEKTRGLYDKFIDNILNFIFSKDKIKLYLLVIVLIGLILRVIAAVNVGVAADDVSHAITAINFLGSGKLEVYHQSTGLWHSVTDIFYKILGQTQFASRFAAVLFGTLSILLIFLLTKEFFNKKIALIAAFLLAISSYHIKNMVAEQDAMVMFFVIFSMFLFVKALNNNKTKFFIISGIFLGLGIFTKLYALLFIPPLCFYAIYKNKEKTGKFLNKEIIKKLFIFGFAAFIFFIPTLTHNYLLYKDKGIMDLQFTRVFGFGRDKSAEYYAWDAQFTAKSDWKGFFFGNPEKLGYNWPSSLYVLRYVFFPDPFVFILGFIGLFFLFKRNKNYLIFFLLCFLIPFVYLASILLLSKHYLFLLFLLIPSAAFSLGEIIKKIQNRFKIKYLFIFLLIFSLIFLGFNIKHTYTHFYGKSDMAQLMSYKEKNIEDNSLVIVDGRIYRGAFTWAFSDKHYLEASYVYDLFNQQENLPGSPISMPVYYIECVRDDCGWGNIGNQPEFNQSMETLLEIFKSQYKAEEVKTIKHIGKEKYYFPFLKSGEGIDSYRVYKTILPLKPVSLEFADSTHIWWLYPVGYDKNVKAIYDEYNVYNSIDALIDKLAHLILYLAVFLCFLSILILIYLASRNENFT